MKNHTRLLPLKMTDYSQIPDWKWQARRLGILLIVLAYLTYVGAFILEVVQPGAVVMMEHLSEARQKAIANGIAFGSKLFQMVSLGVVGGIFILMRSYVRTSREHDYPVAWYLFSPIQGGLLAFFLYCIFRAGEKALYTSPGGEGGMSGYVMGTIAIVAGVFSERAFDMLWEASQKVLKTQMKGGSTKPGKGYDEHEVSDLREGDSEGVDAAAPPADPSD